DRCRHLKLHSLTAQLLENLGERGSLRQIDGESPQRASDRLRRAVVHCGHKPSITVLHDKTFQQVIDVGRLKGEFNLAVPLDFSAMFEEADARAEQDDPLER